MSDEVVKARIRRDARGREELVTPDGRVWVLPPKEDGLYTRAETLTWLAELMSYRVLRAPSARECAGG